MPGWGNTLIGRYGPLRAVVPWITWTFRCNKFFPGTKITWVAKLTVLITCSTCALAVCSNTAGFKFKGTCSTECSLGAGLTCYTIRWSACVCPTIANITRVTLCSGNRKALRITVPAKQLSNKQTDSISTPPEWDTSPSQVTFQHFVRFSPKQFACSHSGFWGESGESLGVPVDLCLELGPCFSLCVPVSLGLG